MTSIENSAQSLTEEATSGRLSRRAQAILSEARERACPFTDRQMLHWLGKSDPNYVRPRITELLEAGALVLFDNVKCPQTGKTVRRCEARSDSEYRRFLNVQQEIKRREIESARAQPEQLTLL